MADRPQVLEAALRELLGWLDSPADSEEFPAASLAAAMKRARAALALPSPPPGQIGNAIRQQIARMEQLDDFPDIAAHLDQCGWLADALEQRAAALARRVTDLEEALLRWFDTGARARGPLFDLAEKMAAARQPAAAPASEEGKAVSDDIHVIELWPVFVTCHECRADGQWQEAREWYEDGPASGSGFFVWICPACLPTVDAMPVREIAPPPASAADGAGKPHRQGEVE